MSEYSAEKDTEREELRKKVDEVHKLFEGTRQNLEAIITMLDEILAQDEVLNKDCDGIDCGMELTLEEQEFLMHGNQRLEP